MIDDQVTRWANFVKDNPDKWKPIHTKFIDAQYEKHKQFLNRLSSTKEGRQKLIRLYDIKNVKGYKNLLK